jgi:hypothetical protein
MSGGRNFYFKYGTTVALYKKLKTFDFGIVPGKGVFRLAS